MGWDGISGSWSRLCPEGVIKQLQCVLQVFLDPRDNTNELDLCVFISHWGILSSPKECPHPSHDWESETFINTPLLVWVPDLFVLSVYTGTEATLLQTFSARYHLVLLNLTIRKTVGDGDQLPQMTPRWPKLKPTHHDHEQTVSHIHNQVKDWEQPNHSHHHGPTRKRLLQYRP